MSLQIVITDAGRAETINAENNGTAPVTISEIGFGSGQYTASAAQTALQAEFKRLNTISGTAVGDDAIHITARDEGADEYQVYEFGLYLASGTLFAVYSQNTSIIDKTSVSIALLAVDIALQSLNPASVTFGDANFINPPASTTSEGVVELATNSEVQAGTDNQRVVTPASLSSRTATTSRTGLVELATNAEVEAGNDSQRAVTPSSLSSRTANAERTGLVELASNSETQNGTDSTRAVTPSSLSSRTATTERTGLVELATKTEAEAGSSTATAVTPAGVHAAFNKYGLGVAQKEYGLTSITEVNSAIEEGSYAVLNVAGLPVFGYGRLSVGSADTGNFKTIQKWEPIGLESTERVRVFRRFSVDAGATWSAFVEDINFENIPESSTAQKGIVELATNSEASSGTDTSRAVTPAGVKAAIENNQPPSATTTTKGLVELSTNTETQAGTDSNRAVTPASLSSRTATTSRTGLVELADNSETQSGSDPDKVVTPASLSSRTATTSRTGLVELATNTESKAGSDTSRAVTPRGVHDAFNQYGLGLDSKSAYLLTTRAQVDALITEGAYGVDNVSMPDRDYGHLEVKNRREDRVTQVWRPLTETSDIPRVFERFSLDEGASWSPFAEVMTDANNEMVGSVAYFITTVAPDGWIKANGAAVSRAAYAKLFAKVGTFWGNGNGSTTFNVPDLRGEFIRCWDDGRGVDSGRSFGTFQADELKEHRHTLPSRDNAGNGNSYIEDADPGGIARTAYTGLEGGSETRPRNVALVAYIKY